MTALQAFGVGFIAVIFFGSIGLGLYLRRRDRLADLAPPPTRPPQKTEPLGKVTSANDVRRKLELVPTHEETLALVKMVERYYAEVERLAKGYHALAVEESEATALKWLRKQTGQDRGI